MEKEIEKEVEINEINYYGYLELYEYKKNPYSEEFEHKLFKKILKFFALFVGMELLSLNFGEISNILVPLIFVSYATSSIIYIKKEYDKYYQENINLIMEQYDVENIKYSYLVKSLEKKHFLSNVKKKNNIEKDNKIEKDNNIVLNNYNYENQKPKVKTYKRK